MIQETGNTHPEPPSHMLVLTTQIWGSTCLLFLPEQPPIGSTCWCCYLTCGWAQNTMVFTAAYLWADFMGSWPGFSWVQCHPEPVWTGAPIVKMLREHYARARSHSPLQCRCVAWLSGHQGEHRFGHNAWLSYHMFQTTNSNSST